VEYEGGGRTSHPAQATHRKRASKRPWEKNWVMRFALVLLIRAVCHAQLQIVPALDPRWEERRAAIFSVNPRPRKYS